MSHDTTRDKRDSQAPLRVAIIGGGISGLAAAYHLTKPSTNRPPCKVVIYEATDHLGGNAYTVQVDLGERRDVLLAQENTATDDPAPARPFTRWADLGVDDFNLDTYTHIAAIMKDIGFTAYRPLEDTASFFTRDGSKVLTADNELRHGASNPQVRIPKALDEAYQAFMRAAAEAVGCPHYHRYTVQQFVDEYRRKHPDVATLVDTLRDDLLYPRISAMYFVDDSGPEHMPLRAVMNYYILQEGFKSGAKQAPSPKRNYFVEGAESWIRCLAGWLEDNRDVSFIRNARAEVRATAGGARVSLPPQAGLRGNPPAEHFDKIVMATHADDALRAIREGVTQDIADILGRVRYTSSLAVAHTYAANLLPADRNAWRTYNVTIRKGTAMKPYRMTYVMNRLQNDAAEWVEDGPDGHPEIKTGPYNRFGLPQFFVSLNPVTPIPDEYVLRVIRQPGQTPGGYAKHFSEDEQRLPGWHAIDEADDRASTWFKHNVLDFNCLDAQEMLDSAQGGDHDNLYFTGGWCKGAGLHEECWLMGEHVAKRVFGEPGDDTHCFDPKATSDADYAPRGRRRPELSAGSRKKSRNQTVRRASMAGMLVISPASRASLRRDRSSERCAAVSPARPTAARARV
ncbi:MAG: FAD-dependent oxidoreductase [Gammaproteobacteria bacterium]|nr:FAD-dependent oxidoreductase [Gammaproteobacteria bacterium]